MTDEHPTLATIHQEIRLLAGDVRSIKRHVVGDSDPERSLLYRMGNTEREVRQLQASKAKVAGLAWASITAVAGAAGVWVWSKVTGGASGGGHRP